VSVGRGEQRFFVGIGHALATPEDFVGARIGLVRTPFLDRVVQSLQAEPVELPDDDPAAYEAQGIDGIITVAHNLALFPDTVMTSNLVPYSVPTIVLANADVMAELTPEQQAVLRQAALELRDQLLTETPEVESSAVRCGIGASVIEATDADVGAIQAATQPVRDSLAEDPATAAFIERIETLKAELPAPSWPATCGAASADDAPLATIPDGTYRAIGTRQDRCEPDGRATATWKSSTSTSCSSSRMTGPTGARWWPAVTSLSSSAQPARWSTRSPVTGSPHVRPATRPGRRMPGRGTPESSA
jgi:hypothetical protein